MIKVTFDVEGVQAQIVKKVRGATNPRDFLGWYKAYLLKEINTRFKTRTGPDGTAWPGRKGNRDASGRLARSIRGDIDGSTLTIWTGERYAWAYQLGAVIKPKKNPSGYLAIPAHGGNEFISPRFYGDMTQLLKLKGGKDGPRPVVLKTVQTKKGKMRVGKEWWKDVMFWFVRSVTIQPHPFFGFSDRDLQAAEDYLTAKFNE